MAKQIDTVEDVRALAAEKGIELNDEWCNLLLELVANATANATGVSVTYESGDMVVTYRARSVHELSGVRRAMESMDKNVGGD